MRSLYGSREMLSLYFKIEEGSSESILQERTPVNYLILGLAISTMGLCFSPHWWAGVVLCILFTLVSLHKSIGFYLYCKQWMAVATPLQQIGSKYSFSSPRCFAFALKKHES